MEHNWFTQGVISLGIEWVTSSIKLSKGKKGLICAVNGKLDFSPWASWVQLQLGGAESSS